MTLVNIASGDVDGLTYWGLVMPFHDTDLGKDWLR